MCLCCFPINLSYTFTCIAVLQHTGCLVCMRSIMFRKHFWVCNSQRIDCPSWSECLLAHLGLWFVWLHCQQILNNLLNILSLTLTKVYFLSELKKCSSRFRAFWQIMTMELYFCIRCECPTIGHRCCQIKHELSLMDCSCYIKSIKARSQNQPVLSASVPNSSSLY